jgi:hypothetical protein
MKTSIEDFGLIAACKRHTPRCHHKCCDFADNYIVLYPGELEKTKLDKSHFGGKKAVCLRLCREDSFKPLDCKSYPFFPKVGPRGEVEIVRGKKCPLKMDELTDHKEKFLEVWRTLIEDSAVLEWLKRVELVAYHPVK